MAKQPTEDELNLRRKARRRLIGAIALTLAVVVILPMVLDSEPKPTGQDIDLRIPDPDKVGEFIPGVAVSEVAEVPPLAASAVEAASAASTAGAADPQPAASQGTASGNSGEPAGAESFVAQVGAYSSADAAKQELDRLKKLGFRMAYIEKVGDKTRVRVGPYPEREKAEQVRQMLEKHGLKPIVMGLN